MPESGASYGPADTRIAHMTSEAVRRTPAARVTGSGQLCRVCGEAFTSTEAGDLHRIVVDTHDVVRAGRVLSISNERRRCLTVAEMIDKGMTRDARGLWQRGNANRKTVRGPWMGPGRAACSDLTAAGSSSVIRGRAAPRVGGLHAAAACGGGAR